jgi:hypothetical protein
MGRMPTRTEARRERLTEASRPLPGPVWFILLLGAVLTDEMKRLLVIVEDEHKDVAPPCSSAGEATRPL